MENIKYYLDKINNGTININDIIELQNNGICVIYKKGKFAGFTK